MGTRATAGRRLALYRERLALGMDAARAVLGYRAADRVAWLAVREAWIAGTEHRDDREIAATFFNSAARRLLSTVGLDPDIELRYPAGSHALVAEPLPADDGMETCIRRLLARLTWGAPYADAEGDAHRVARVMDADTRDVWRGVHPTSVELVPTPFYRNKGAYVMARVRRGDEVAPLVLAFLHDERGVRVDAALPTSDEASVVFGFSWSYFHVDAPRPGALVDFLQSVMPLKRRDELYTSIGFNRHGKTELYRSVMEALQQPGTTFEPAEGARGLVMAVFILPEVNVVFKVIRDAFGFGKSTTRREVMEKYQFVFVRDRVGRLADAQEFEHVEFPRACFPPALLDELREAAPSIVQVAGDSVRIGHLYTERRLTPLNLYLQRVGPEAAREAILDYGRAIRDLAAADIFAGDMLLKNFGVSRHGRVIFYDYDELSTITACRFRRMPSASTEADEMAAEPWFSMGEQDVFPEEFLPFLVPEGPLREAFTAAHNDLLTVNWWRGVQERLAAGEMFDFYPYAAGRRFGT